MIAVSSRSHLHLLEFVDRKGLPAELKKPQQGSKESIGSMPPSEEAMAELAEYFAARCDRFSTPLAMSASPSLNVCGTYCEKFHLVKSEDTPKLPVRSVIPPQFARLHATMVPI